MTKPYEPALYRRAISDTVRARRAGLGLTHEALAERANLSRGTISRIETGKHYPLWVDAFRLAAALDWTLSAMTAAVETRAGEIAGQEVKV